MADPVVRSVSWNRVREPDSRRAFTLIRIETSTGVTGFGECGPVPRSELEAIHILEKPATAVEPIRQQLASRPRVRAAVDMALLDISAKVAGVPVYQLLGGPTRNKARAVSRIEGPTGKALETDMRRCMAAGYKAFLTPMPEIKTEIMRQDAFVKAVEERLESLRGAAGTGFDFVLDAAGALTPGQAANVAAAIERMHPLWIDEPCPVSNMATIRKISEESVAPVGFGREFTDGGPFQDLLREGLIDILRPDLALHGISGIRRLAAMAETYYTAVAPYHDGGPVATAATLQLAASLPNFFIQQIPLPASDRDREMRAAITGGSVEVVEDGFARLPRGPGLGIEVDMDAVRKYTEEMA
jgi:galactonate dehydratase